MRHTTEQVLHRLLDEPAGVADSDRRHIASCAQCLDRLAAVHAGAASVDRPDATGPSTTTRPPDARPAARPRGRRSSRTLRRPAIAAVAVALALTGASTAAANDWLQVFATQRIAPVAFSPDELVALPDLSAYGELTLSGDPDVREVPDAQAARAASGLDVPEVAQLPRGISGEPVYTVGNEVSATFTFSAERAAAAAAATGQELPPVPEGLDGSSVRLDAGPGVAQVWSSDAGAPGLFVGRAVAPTAFATGVSFETARDYLLSLPGLPEDVAAQLRTFAADGSTLPLPVPADEVTTTSAEVDGAQATVVSTRDRSLTGVVWVDAGVVTVVGGSLDEDEVLSVARGLQ